MVEQIGITTGGNKKELQGMSTDTKPITDIGPGSTFYEVDSKNGFTFSNSSWWPV